MFKAHCCALVAAALSLAACDPILPPPGQKPLIPYPDKFLPAPVDPAKGPSSTDSCIETPNGTLEGSDSLGLLTVQELLDRYATVHEGTFTHTPRPMDHELRVVLGADDARRLGSVSIEAKGTKIRSVTSTSNPPKAGNGDIFPVHTYCLDTIDVDVTVRVRSDDNTLDERFDAVLRLVDPRDPESSVLELSMITIPKASLLAQRSALSFEGSQSFEVVKNTSAVLEGPRMALQLLFLSSGAMGAWLTAPMTLDDSGDRKTTQQILFRFWRNRWG